MRDWAFDESTYLTMNPDVAQAVRGGSFSSGADHFIAHGCSERRPGVSPEVRGTIQELLDVSLPLPPEHLRKRVHGDATETSFTTVGKLVAVNILSALRETTALAGSPRILDFGCGCGRIVRYFHKLSGPCSLYGTDIDGEAIAWCRSNLQELGEFSTNRTSPPLRYENDYFDFVYSISIFTHLPEDMQWAWLEELRRVTRPGGYLLLTVHGEELFNGAPEAYRRQLREKGFYYSIGAITDGLPDFYQTTYHTDDYIRSRWSRLFTIEKVVKRGIANKQDLVLCRKPAN